MESFLTNLTQDVSDKTCGGNAHMVDQIFLEIVFLRNAKEHKEQTFNS